MKLIDRTGERYGRLLVLEQAPAGPAPRYATRWRCQCDCGNVVVVSKEHLRRGSTQSCGCLAAERSAQRSKARTQNLRERFMQYVNLNGPMPTVCAPSFENCWLWTGARNNGGYGQFITPNGRAGATRNATHVSWFLEHGVWPKQNMCHVCDTTACIRPSHLFEGDDLANAYDRQVKAAGGILVDVPYGPSKK